jgi:hypothetical protein
MSGKILFCNIAYMKYYDSDVQEYDVPKNGGRYVNENNDALEKDNFHLCRDGYIRGYVETKYNDGYQIASKPKDLHIERIEKGSTDSISEVTIIFCAKSDIVGKTIIVGWYNNATVYRKRQIYKDRQYNIIARVEDCVRVEEADRHFIIPRSKGKDGVGFGQANVWYADKENAQELVGAVKTYICDNSSDKISEYTVGEDKEEYSESGIGIKVVTNKYERNPNAEKEMHRASG